MSDSFEPIEQDSFTPLTPLSTPTGATPPATHPLLEKAAQTIELPERGMRGIGVGLERALAGTNPTAPLLPSSPMSPADVSTVGNNAPSALQRAAAATEPGYTPLPGEKLGSYIGSTVGSLPMAYLLAGMGDEQLFAKIPYGLKTLYSVTRGGISGGALSAISQAADEGRITISGTAPGIAVGSAIPLVRPAANIIQNVLNDVGELLPVGTSVQPFATKVLKENPRLLGETPGTAESVGEKIDNIQKSLIGLERKAGTELAAVKGKYGLPTATSAPPGLLRGSSDPMTQHLLDEGTKPYTADQALGLWQETQKPEFQDLPADVKIKTLYQTKQALEDGVNFSKTRTDVPPIGSAVEGVLKQRIKDMTQAITDAGGNDLNQSSAYYSTVRHLRDQLQQKLATVGKAEQTIMHVVKNGDTEDIIGIDKDVINQIKQLEQETGTNLLEPLRKDLAAKNLNEMRATWYRGFLGRALGKEGLQVALPAIDTTGKIIQKAGQAVGSSAGKTTLTSGGVNLPSIKDLQERLSQ